MEGMMEYETNYGEDKHRKSYGHYYWIVYLFSIILILFSFLENIYYY